MQTVYSIGHIFGGRNYMQRSKKRRPISPAVPTPPPEKKPRRPRKRRAGFFYGCATFFLLILLWPIGLVLLWQKKIRWHAASKLLASVLSLAACIFLFGFALTVDTGNVRYTALQDGINAYLDSAAAHVISFGDYAGERMADAFGEARDFGSALAYRTRKVAADGIREGIRLTASLRAKLAPVAKESDTEDEASASPASSATPAPAVTAGRLPLYVPGNHPDAADGREISVGLLKRDGTLDADATFATVSPETLARTFTVKSAGEATVYYNDGSKYYHRSEQCGSMRTSTAHRFEETRDKKYRQCSGCAAPAKNLLGETEIAWVDAANVAHLSDECSAFEGDWTLMTAAQAIEDGCTGCIVCGANRYLEAVADGREVTVCTPAPDAAG